MKKVKLLCSILLILILVFLMFGCSKPKSSIKKKTIYECNKIEKAAIRFTLKESCEQILENDEIVAFYETTCYQIPEKSGYIGKTGDSQKAKKPIKGFSVSYQYNPDISPDDFEREIINGHTEWEEEGKIKKLKVTKVIVEISPGSGGGGMYSLQDMVTLIPLEVEVIE